MIEELLNKIEGYGFQCDGGPLTLCQDWMKLRVHALLSADRSLRSDGATPGEPSAQAEPVVAGTTTTEDMLQSWLQDADSRIERLSQHLRSVLEVAHTWQPNYATVMDRQTLRLAAEQCDYEAARELVKASTATPGAGT